MSYVADNLRRDIAELQSQLSAVTKERDALLKDLDAAWSFDSNQQHTHSWHDKQDFMKKHAAKGESK